MSQKAVLQQNVSDDIDEVVIEKDSGGGPPPILKEPFFDPGDNGSNGDTGKPIGNAFLAMLLFISADVMFFAGLIGAFIVFRFGAENWPPPGQPLLPVGVTGVNTVVLLFSGATMAYTWRLLTRWHRPDIIKWLTITAACGIAFLLVQGYEWIRLIRFGLTLQSSVYGATFYTLIGCHGLHVLGAVVWLTVVVFKLHVQPSAYGPNRHGGIKLIGLYWFLVVALWPILYGLVYLS